MSASARVSTRDQSPVGWLLLVAPLTVLGTGGVWLWAVFTAPVTVMTFVAWFGGVAAGVVCIAVTVGAWCFDALRRARERNTALRGDADQLDRDMRRLVDETLPVLVGQVREGKPVDLALAEASRPADATLRRLLSVVSQEVVAGERSSAAAAARCADLEEQAARVADDMLPGLVKRVREDRASVNTVLAELPRPADATLQRVWFAVAQEIGMGERRGAAAMLACASAAARVQAQNTRMLAELRELQDRYGDEEVFGDLLELDHRTSQMGRLADSIVLLSGGRSGRRWTKPIVMESILRGAMGRIDDYRRIQTHSTSTVAVAGYAAEGVMHALAELLDNATGFSARPSTVHVYVEEEDAGVVIMIEDGGLGMRKRERLRAEETVSEPMGLTALSGTRLGLAVVGCLADKYGLGVSFRPSARGGTGVLLMIPRQLITQPRQDDPRGVAPGGNDVPDRSDSPRPALPETPKTVETVADDDGGGLPQRRRGATFAAASESVSAPAPAPAPAQDGHEAGARLAAFQQAGGRDAPRRADSG